MVNVVVKEFNLRMVDDAQKVVIDKMSWRLSILPEFHMQDIQGHGRFECLDVCIIN